MCLGFDSLDKLGYNVTKRYISNHNMSINSVKFRQFILGLLAQQAMSGYDIKRVLKELGWLVGTPSFGSLYPALHTLLDNGLVTVKVVSRQDKPSRKIYTITQAGQQALQEWASQPIGSNLSLKSFIMRLILADSFTKEELRTQLCQRRDQVMAHHTALEKASGLLDETSSFGQRLASDYSLALADAELSWIEGTLNHLSQEPSPMEAEQAKIMDHK